MARKTMPPSLSEKAARERDLEAWMDRALHARKADPEPNVHDI